LTLWLCCGRSSETSNLHLDGLKSDSLFSCALRTDVPQSKSSKSKKICLVAGAGRHLSWFPNFGDCLLLLQYSSETRPPPEVPRPREVRDLGPTSAFERPDLRPTSADPRDLMPPRGSSMHMVL